MAMKYCKRCQFAVRDKAKLCAICGNRNFYVPSAPLEPPAIVTATYNMKALARAFKNDVIEAARSSAAISKQVLKAVFTDEPPKVQKESQRDAA